MQRLLVGRAAGIVVSLAPSRCTSFFRQEAINGQPDHRALRSAAQILAVSAGGNWRFRCVHVARGDDGLQLFFPDAGGGSPLWIQGKVACSVLVTSITGASLVRLGEEEGGPAAARGGPLPVYFFFLV